MVSNQVCVETSVADKADLNHVIQLDDMGPINTLGTTGDAVFEEEDSKTYVDEIYAMCKKGGSLWPQEHQSK